MVGKTFLLWDPIFLIELLSPQKQIFKLIFFLKKFIWVQKCSKNLYWHSKTLFQDEVIFPFVNFEVSFD
jgi:hypothetical protein